MGLVLKSQHKALIKCDDCRVQDSLSEAGSKVKHEQMAECFSCSEIGGTEWYASVAQK